MGQRLSDFVLAAELRQDFDEQGVAMLSSVLRSEKAMRVNVEIMRAFVRLRELAGHDDKLARRFDAIRELMAPPAAAPKRRIGFIAGE